MAVPPAATPPEASTPIRANCEPPLNMTRLSTQACQTSSPDAVASAPNEIPYRAVAMPTAQPERAAARSSLVRSWRIASRHYLLGRRSAEQAVDQVLGGRVLERPGHEDHAVDDGSDDDVEDVVVGDRRVRVPLEQYVRLDAAVAEAVRLPLARGRGAAAEESRVDGVAVVVGEFAGPGGEVAAQV